MRSSLAVQQVRDPDRYCSAGLIPGPETSTCHRHREKEKRITPLLRRLDRVVFPHLHKGSGCFLGHLGNMILSLGPLRVNRDLGVIWRESSLMQWRKDSTSFSFEMLEWFQFSCYSIIIQCFEKFWVWYYILPLVWVWCCEIMPFLSFLKKRHCQHHL